MNIKNRFKKIKIRLKKFRKRIKNNNLNRLTVYKTSKHIYAKIISINNKNIEISASSTEKIIYKYLKDNNIYTGNKKSAEIVGKVIAERSINKNISNVFFDRSGFKFHGRIKSLADSAKLNGLLF